MKIAVVTGDDVAGDGPAQLCSALATRGHDVTCHARQQRRPRAQRSAEPNFRVVATRVGPPPGGTAADVLPFVGDWAAILQRRWSHDRPDIVHAHGWLGGLAAQLAARRQSWPTVQTFQCLAAARTSSADRSDDSARQRIEPLLARHADWVTVESTADLEALTRSLHSRSRMSVISGGVDGDRYTPVGRADDHSAAVPGLLRVLCIAQNPLWVNGIDTVIAALSRVASTELVIAESGPDSCRDDRARAKLERFGAKLGVDQRIRFLGAVTDDDMPALLRSCDVLLCTPQRPPTAASVLQAMASGLAIVGPAIGVLDDLVVHDVTGLLAAGDDPRDLASALRILAAERFRCSGMGATGRNRALSRYTWDRIALDSLAIYEKLSSERVVGEAMEEVTR
ncbi:glycosyltransferase [Mycobacterium sherrisii]|uniref:glycosyltransferase n=1 Tax=Mycobacterium sherrisii TaxID=243061 RepID=UPI002DDD1D66|nr:glycosyltransferase [Mycobacterium sherrisii]MEC4763928.1 glycosyltransferase [Mycobacterium sherrisii]